MRSRTTTDVEANARAFGRLVALVRRRAAAGRLDSAAAWSRVAAGFATANPHGALRDVDLERALDAVSRRALPALPRPEHPGEGGGRRVLHVLSEAHLIGGHVRMALRWVESDRASVPGLVVTRPFGESEELTAAVRRRGGSATVLDEPSLPARARRLRQIAGAAEIVVCHTHPDDPVPALAFGGAYDGAPVVMVNHADHVFWLGTGNVSVLLSLREIGAEAAVAARGYPRRNQLVVPTPLPGVARRLDRETAKRRLGIDPSRLLALTLARPVKYAATSWHPGFADVVGPPLRHLPELTLMAVGPAEQDAAWSSLAGSEQVALTGMQPDPSVHLDAADLYLDSFPFGSVTSMLEAATRGTPVLASRMHRGMQTLMSSSGPLDGAVEGAADVEAYREALAGLVSDPERRTRIGRAAAEASRRDHGEEAWIASLERIYDLARTVAPDRLRRPPSAASEELAEYAEAVMGIEPRTPLLWTIGFCREGFDAADRRSSRARALAVRAAQKASGRGPGRGPTAASCLIPATGATA